MEDVTIRQVTEADLWRLTEIHNNYVINTLTTFDLAAKPRRNTTQDVAIIARLGIRFNNFFHTESIGIPRVTTNIVAFRSRRGWQPDIGMLGERIPQRPVHNNRLWLLSACSKRFKS